MKLILTGDVNLMNVTEPAVPFARVAPELRGAAVFSNFECCLFDPGAHSFHNEGFYADPGAGGEALKTAGIDAVGIANNVNYGEAAIIASIARLDALGVGHTGAGRNLAAARAPAIVKRDGLTCGFLQRSSVYWPTNHEAGEEAAGIAVIRGHTAYHVPMHKTRPEIPPPNRPGVPPEIVTWADAAYLHAFADDVAALRAQADIVVASCHWGLGQEVLAYMTQIAHAAVDAGAHVVMGHGPHYSLPVEVYKGRPIFYGLGSFSFHTGHGGRRHGDWLGMMVRAEIERDGVKRTAFQFVRHNERNETVLCALADERPAFEDLARRSAHLGARLSVHGDEVLVEPAV
ncbi:MAG TPA: CapA family protein [Xanthobacteraceae bacterium]|jgi:poly-gamma-glutamate synthesis protein (capsule biosynthesis protein)|nr:CapA family protein [Xanthobacteraceae bacterium]